MLIRDDPVIARAKRRAERLIKKHGRTDDVFYFNNAGTLSTNGTCRVHSYECDWWCSLRKCLGLYCSHVWLDYVWQVSIGLPWTHGKTKEEMLTKCHAQREKEMAPRKPQCHVDGECDWHYPDGIAKCNRPEGHDGPHGVAVNGFIIAPWPNEKEDCHDAQR